MRGAPFLIALCLSGCVIPIVFPLPDNTRHVSSSYGGSVPYDAAQQANNDAAMKACPNGYRKDQDSGSAGGSGTLTWTIRCL
jgi:hypothetical protein